MTSEKYAAVARKICGNFSDGWTYAEIKSCEVKVKYFCGRREDLIYFTKKEKSAEICKKHPELKYCPPAKNLTKSDFDLCDKLSI